MVVNNKSTILTVSYGTFSCTLEGFDDSFDTMKAIAEYFRDLAADDRYFGAEPPTPDAEMLMRIAEKEVARKVEAVSHDGGITLRPYEGDQVDEAEETPPEPVAVAAPAATENDTVGYLEDDENAESFFADTEATPLSGADESVAARLQRIRAAAAQTVVVAADQPEAIQEAIEETIADDVDVAEDEAFEELLEDEGTDVELSIAEDFEEEVEEDVAEVEDVDDEESEEDDFAALLADIEPEAPQEETASDEDAIEENDDAPDFEAPKEALRARVLHVKGAALESDDDGEDDLLDDDIYDEDAEPNALDPDTLNAIFDEDEDFDAVGEETESSLSAEDEADLMRELAEVEADDAQEEVADWDGLLDEDAEVVVADEENLFSNDPEEALATAQDLSNLLSEPQAEEEISRLMAETESQLSSEDANRRRKTIDHLKAAVASKKADVTEGNVDPDSIDASAYIEDLNEVVKPRRPVLRGTTTQRAVPVDATPLKLVAEQKIVPESTRKSEPATRPTLVKPVRPRRIRATSTAAAEAAAILDEPEPIVEMQTEAVEFAEYASMLEVDKLPELLEASAAHAIYVENLEKFSRPQLMMKVRQVMGDDFSREDCLRAFGQLLREGKITKLDGGRFSVSDTIGFQPE